MTSVTTLVTFRRAKDGVYGGPHLVRLYGCSTEDRAIIRMKKDGWLAEAREEPLLTDTVSCGGDGEELINDDSCVTLPAYRPKQTL